ncbi:PREDICTED: E3 ubiquitin-protein ligase RNF181-like [Camelina sativa]|uniref:E3 ubiquitin-protein ligase RNF181-like n=1 Tax=Camelina sativa TaxID=90675 RepID=A0ABM1R9D1_CAMSA|nr:PREDICTED: E3 ubiquitin-protein ligase RNF181-like [Camelina sativa]
MTSPRPSLPRSVTENLQSSPSSLVLFVSVWSSRVCLGNRTLVSLDLLDSLGCRIQPISSVWMLALVNASRFLCPYCPCPYYHLHDDVPLTSERFYYNNYSNNSSPDPYTLRRSFSDISLHSMYSSGSNELGESVGSSSNGLPEWKISNLPTHKYGKKPKFKWWWQKKKKFVANDTQCSICLVDYEKGDKMITLPCKHIYHKDCLSRWLKENRVCCVCKREVF